MLWRLFAAASGLSTAGMIAQVGGAGDSIPGPLQDVFVASPFAGLLLWLFLAERKDSREQRAKHETVYRELMEKYDQLQEKRLAEQRDLIPLLTHAVDAVEGQGRATRALVEQPLLPADVVKELRRLGRVLDDIEGGR